MPARRHATRPRGLRRRLVLLGVPALVLLIAGWSFLGSGSDADPGRSGSGALRERWGAFLANPAPGRVLGADTAPVTARISVGAPLSAPPVARSFLGFSVEYQSIAVDAGPAEDPDTVLDRLVENLDPGQRPVIRIGGDSTDHTWYPVSGAAEPGLTFALTPDWLASVARFATATNARLILGIDLEVNRPTLAGVEARALLRAIGADHILAWEVGNEPNLYASFPWYVKVKNDPTTGVYTRPRDYSFAQYLREFDATAARLPKLPLAGPALGQPDWMADLPELLKADPTLQDVTYHTYPLNCFAQPGNPAYSTLANLLAPDASIGLAAEVTRFAAEARATRRQFRVDELNSSACGGTTGVSDTFASALWITDTLFAMAAQGVSGVNIQDFNSSRYKPFSFSRVDGHWVAQVEPLYYGLQLFSQAAPPGSQLLSVRTRAPSSLRAWAARTAAGAETVTVINESARHAETVAIAAPDTDGGALAEMRAPSLTATGGVTLGGLSYGPSTTTGLLGGSSTVESVGAGASAHYTITVPPASAALLTLKRR